MRKRPEREYGEVEYAAQGWKQEERLICKTEVTPGPRCPKLNPRFMVINLAAADGWTSEAVYVFYCGRGEPENRIKDLSPVSGSSKAIWRATD